MRHRRTWTPEEDAILRRHYVEGGLRAVADLLPGRSRNAIYVHVHELGLSGLCRPGPKKAKAATPQEQLRRERFFQEAIKPIADRRNQARARPCLNCGTRFTSQGNHNRLCQNCRTGSLTPFDIPHGVGQ